MPVMIHKDRMNVLFLTNNPNLESTARIIQYWIQLGQERGLRGSIVVRHGSKLINWGRENHVSIYVDSMPWFDRDRPWQAVYHAAKVAWWAHRAGINVIHSNEQDIYPFAALLKRLLRRPTVCHIRSRISREFASWAFGGHNAPDALFWSTLQQKTDSFNAVKDIVSEDKQHLIPLGVDLSTFGTLVETREDTRRQWGIGNDEILIGTASAIRQGKRIEDFIQLICSLAKLYPNVVGIIAGAEIAGEEQYRAHIEQLIVSSTLGRRLKWVGHLEPVEPFYHACDICVSTSEYETFGNSVCEAMACSKPVAGYCGGAVAEVVGDAGLIVKTGDIENLKVAVESLVLDDDLRRKLGAQAQARVAREFNPAATLTKLLAIYRTLLTDKR